MFPQKALEEDLLQDSLLASHSLVLVCMSVSLSIFPIIIRTPVVLDEGSP